MLMGEPERVIVAVSNNVSCKDAIRWALANKIKKDTDTLIMLHVVTRIPSPMGMEMYQSEVNNTMFVHYVRTVVQPMMMQLKKLVDSKVKLELKVARNNSCDKGIVEEAKKLNATVLCLGSSAKGVFPANNGTRRGMTTGTGAYCIRAKPPGLAVYVVQKDKVIMSTESVQMSPVTSNNNSPTNSGRLVISSGTIPRESNLSGSGALRPNYDNTLGEVMDNISTTSLSGRLLHAMSKPQDQLDAHYQSAASTAYSMLSNQYSNSNNNSNNYSSSSLQAQALLARNIAAANSRSGKYGTWNGTKNSDSSSGSGFDSGRILHPSADYGRQNSAAWLGMAPTPNHNAPPQSLGAVFADAMSDGHHSTQSTEDVVADIDSWAKEIHDRNHVSQMKELEGKLSHARAALASFPTFIKDAVQELEREDDNDFYEEYRKSAANGSGQRAAAAPAQQARAPLPAREPVYLSMDDTDLSVDTIMAATATGIEGALLRELAVMRKKAAEAEKARENAESRAEQLLAAANLSIREVEAQSKRREMENVALMERVSREAMRAKLSEGEARQVAAMEARRKEAAMQSLSALESESKKRLEAEGSSVRVQSTARHYQKYTWEELAAATDNFNTNRKLGEGGFGIVYKGTLHHTPVAIKILKNANALQAASEFQQEMDVLGQIQHPHTVMLLGCCPEKYSLVYEYMAHGSLEDRLACKDNSPPMPWYVRFRIAAEVASALIALHTRPQPIVHRDLKPANILLAKNYIAKLGDVGLAKLMPELNNNRTYMRDSVPVGTFAYVDPEFQRTGEFGPKSDVYAFGIVILDLLTGRKPSVYEHLEEAIDARDYRKFASFLDEKAGRWPLELTMDVAVLAVKCSEMRRRKRPDLEKDVMPLLDRAHEVATKAEDEEYQSRGSKTFQDAPSSLFCPITQEIMVNPVLASDGHTYELVAIQQWLETNDRSPMTNAKLPNQDLVPNHAVRSMIREWQERSSKF